MVGITSYKFVTKAEFDYARKSNQFEVKKEAERELAKAKKPTDILGLTTMTKSPTNVIKIDIINEKKFMELAHSLKPKS